MCSYSDGRNEPIGGAEETNLVGSTEGEVRTILGAPDFAIEHGNATYLLYGASGTEETFILTHPVFYILAMSGPVLTGNVMHCLLVEVVDGTVVRTELQSRGGRPTECPLAFSNDKKFMQFATAWVTSRAMHGDVLSALETAWEFGDPEVLRNLVERGDIDAALVLAEEFDELEPLRKFAERGDVEAAIELARLDNPTYLRKLADKGAAVAALEVYSSKKDRLVDRPADSNSAWRYLCVAANKSFPAAQLVLGDWTRESTWCALEEYAEEGADFAVTRLEWLRTGGIQSDNRVAYMWFTLAVEGGDTEAKRHRYSVAPEMTSVEIAEAEQMARDWKPGQCPAP